MLHLAVFMFLQGAIYVAVGVDQPYSFFPSTSGEAVGFGVKDNTLPFFQNSNSSNPIELTFSKWRSRTGRNGPPIIEDFANDFIKRVTASKKLQDAFQVQGFNAKSLGSFFYDYVSDVVSDVGALDASVTAGIMSEAMTNNFHKLNEDKLLRLYAYAVADYLFFRGFLNPNSIASLSQEYFTSTEKRINSVKNPTPEENIRAVANGLNDFLISRGLLEPCSTARIAEVISNRLYEI